MDKGKIIESGSHAALLRKKGAYYNFYTMQSSGFCSKKGTMWCLFLKNPYFFADPTHLYAIAESTNLSLLKIDL